MFLNSDLQLPKIVCTASCFTHNAMQKLGIKINHDHLQLIEVNKMWSNRNYFNVRENIPRVPGFENMWPTHILRPHQYSSTCLPLDEIAHNRAKQILDTNRPIKFFWSGGIDSTFALSHLLEHLKNPNQLTVYHTCESTQENPDYVPQILKHGVDMKSWSDLWETPFEPNDLVVTATTADNITASVDQSFYNEYGDWLQRSWQDYFLFRGMSAEKISWLENKLKLHENSITTTLEARWWFYYAIRHQLWVIKDWNLNLENNFGSVICFFDCYDFDAWSQVNRNQFFYGNQWNTYKQAFKNEIYKLWPNNHFNQTKEKTNSGYNIFWGRRKTAQFDQQYLFLYLDKKNSIRSFRPRYWPIINKSMLLEDLSGINEI